MARSTTKATTAKCKFSNICWRCSYSRIILDGEQQQAHLLKQIDLVMLGYATPKMTQRGDKNSIYARNFPTPNGDGSTHNLCPSLTGEREETCQEYQYESKRVAKKKRDLERLADARKKRAKAQGGRVRVALPIETRKRVAQKYKYNCAYCGRNTQTLKRLGVKMAVDHYIPLARGGHPTCESNLVLSCDECNGLKGAKHPSEGWEIGCRIHLFVAPKP